MRQIMPILFVVVATLSVAFSGALAVLILTSGSCQLATQPAMAVLSYEIDRDRNPRGVEPSPDRLVAALDKRINQQRWSKTARVEAIDGGVVEVTVFGRDPASVDRVERSVATTGNVAIGTLAGEMTHDTLTQRAGQSAADLVRDDQGNPIGRWVEILPQAEFGGSADNSPCRRTIERDGRSLTQVLVVDNGSLEVNSVLRARFGRDFDNRPTINLELTDEGKQQFAALAAAHPLQHQWNGWGLFLGVLVDGKLFAVTPATFTASREVQVTGTFTDAEARQWVDIMNSGPLPAPLRLLGKRAPKR